MIAEVIRMSPLSKKYGTYERQIELLKMLKETNAFLMENGIKYSLCGGTLIGAVREGGFIPWDDDVDIMMDRCNYEKMIKLFSSENEKYDLELKRILWVHRIQRKGDSNGLFSPTIDVFVMDNSPDNAIVREIKVALIMLLQGMMKQKQEYNRFSFIYKVCLWGTKILGLLFSDETKFKWYTAVAKIGNNNKTRYITGYTDSFNLLRLRYNGNVFDKIINQKFEDFMLPVTAEYDNYLSTQYGDYMILPPEEKRVPAHSDK